uniref:Reverse transcriptase domain-containing protein n=1 Tax=Amphimedon queenslandica TaxID=400682 RepID=A0A1X7T431_AMPQE
MPFWLQNAAQTLQRFIEKVLQGLYHTYAYIDDVLIASANEAEHKKHLQEVFTCLREYGIVVNQNNLVFDHCTPKSAVKNFPLLKSQQKLWEFLGLINFYHRFIPHCAQVLTPLHTLLSNTPSNTDITWSSECISAFNEAKTALAEATYLSYPKPNALTSVMTNASDVAVRAALQQYSPRQIYHLDYISQFTTDICHINGQCNPVAEALS